MTTDLQDVFWPVYSYAILSSVVDTNLQVI